MTTLRTLPLDGNPLRSIRRELVAGEEPPPRAGAALPSPPRLSCAAQPTSTLRSASALCIPASPAKPAARTPREPSPPPPPRAAGPISQLLTFLASRQADEEAAGSAALPGRLGARQASGVRSGNLFGQDEAALAADAARKLRLGAAAAAAAAEVEGRPSGGAGGGGGGGGGGGARGGGGELVLARAGLREVPGEVWDAGPSLTRLDVSGNKVRR
jgi:hypothetical protein